MRFAPVPQRNPAMLLDHAPVPAQFFLAAGFPDTGKVDRRRVGGVARLRDARSKKEKSPPAMPEGLL